VILLRDGLCGLLEKLFDLGLDGVVENERLYCIVYVMPGHGQMEKLVFILTSNPIQWFSLKNRCKVYIDLIKVTDLVWIYPSE